MPKRNYLTSQRKSPDTDDPERTFLSIRQPFGIGEETSCGGSARACGRQKLFVAQSESPNLGVPRGIETTWSATQCRHLSSSHQSPQWHQLSRKNLALNIERADRLIFRLKQISSLLNFVGCDGHHPRLQDDTPSFVNFPIADICHKRHLPV